MPALPSGMIDFDAAMYPHTVTYYPLVLEHTGDMGEEEETWPGPGVPLACCASQGMPQDRDGHQVEETVTGWTVWFPYDALVTADVVVDRGDRLVLANAHAGNIVLRVESRMTDHNEGVSWFVQARHIL
jgi:hypothetical protein